ncbi:MAG: hypothetical protein JST70_15005 [Bacteroidetes bacterium]|nr:hypothetical protein [Bacteroidota bacterium]
MKYYTLLLAAFLLIISCRKNNTPTNSQYKDIETFSYLPNRYIDSVQDYHTKEYILTNAPGTHNTVIQYDHIIATTGYDYLIEFVVDSNATSFVYADNELKQHLAHYTSTPRYNPSERINMRITTGTVSGKKVGAAWQVSINVQLPVTDNTTGVTRVEVSHDFLNANAD